MGMMGGQHGMWHGWPMGLIWLLLAAGVVALIWWAARRGGGDTGGASPRTLLDRRYARGEIDRSEYERMRADLDAEATPRTEEPSAGRKEDDHG